MTKVGNSDLNGIQPQSNKSLTDRIFLHVNTKNQKSTDHVETSRSAVPIIDKQRFNKTAVMMYNPALRMRNNLFTNNILCYIFLFIRYCDLLFFYCFVLSLFWFLVYLYFCLFIVTDFSFVEYFYLHIVGALVFAYSIIVIYCYFYMLFLHCFISILYCLVFILVG